MIPVRIRQNIFIRTGPGRSFDFIGRQPESGDIMMMDGVEDGENYKGINQWYFKINENAKKQYYWGGGISANEFNNVPLTVFEQALSEKFDAWQVDFGGPFESISIGKKYINEFKSDINCIQFDIVEKRKISILANMVPAIIEYTDSAGKSYQLPTDVTEVGGTKTNISYDPTQEKSIGASLEVKLLGLSCSRKDSPVSGTIGLRVFKQETNKYYLLSCYHVLFPNELYGGLYSIQGRTGMEKTEISSPSFVDNNNSNNEIATVSEGVLTDRIDIGLAELDDKDILSNRIYGTTIIPDKIRIVTLDDVNKNIEVLMVGRTSGCQRGIIVSYRGTVTINYPTSQDAINNRSISGIIKTSKISAEGDSGAAVYDKEGQILGILFASNNRYSYIIPIYNILSTFKIEIK